MKEKDEGRKIERKEKEQHETMRLRETDKEGRGKRLIWLELFSRKNCSNKLWAMEPAQSTVQRENFRKRRQIFKETYPTVDYVSFLLFMKTKTLKNAISKILK